ncbi:MAG: hypothetical protein ACYC66_00405 [Chloroflexota bacterium]
MIDRPEAERFASALDRLLAGEPEPTDDEEMDSLLAVATRLRQEAPAGEPDPESLIRLREELVGDARPGEPAPAVADRSGNCRGHAPSLRRLRRPSGWRRWGLRAAAVLIVLAAGTLALSSWPGRDAGVGSTALARLPSLLEVASAHAEQAGEDAWRMIGDATFHLASPLPKAPERARVYRQLQEPIDEEGARELAGRLGITVANVVDETHSGVLVVTGDGGRLVVSESFQGYFSFDRNGQRSDPLVAAPVPPSFAPHGATVTPAPTTGDATRVAGEFLRSRGLLPPEHIAETADDAPAGVTPLNRKVTFVPTVEGRAVRGMGITVTVGPDGRITGIQSAYARLAPGDAYPVVSAEEAYRRLEDGRPDLLQARQRSGSSASSFSSVAATAFPVPGGQKEEPPPYRVGEAVELEGLLSAVAYEARDGGRRYVATLLAGPKDAPTRVQFKLVGTEVEELSRLDQQHVRVWGRVEQLSTQPPGGRLRVEGFEKLYPQERLVTLLGRIEIEGEGDGAALALATDDGKRYALESPGGIGHHYDNRGRRMIVEGRTTQRTSREGYPMIELAGMSGGSDVDQMKDLSGYQPRPHPQVIPERPPMITGEVEVRRAALEYYAAPAASLPYGVSGQEPFLLVQPVYGFSGVFGGGTDSFEAYVQAVRPEHVEGMR